MDLRVGHGFDVHRFTDDPQRRLVLGGVELPGPGLAGHSDADVVAHAIIDALLGAAGLGDIGAWFPESDPTYSGADSIDLLRRTVTEVSSRWRVVNVDVTVVAEQPRLAPHRMAIEARLGAVVGAPVSVKAKTAEGLGPLGRREGLASWAVALLVGRD